MHHIHTAFLMLCNICYVIHTISIYKSGGGIAHMTQKQPHGWSMLVTAMPHHKVDVQKRVQEARPLFCSLSWSPYLQARTASTPLRGPHRALDQEVQREHAHISAVPQSHRICEPKLLPCGARTAHSTRKCSVSTPMPVDRKPRQKMDVE